MEIDKILINNLKTEIREKPIGIHLRLDKKVLQAYKDQGKGYQTLMQDILSEYAKYKFNI